MRRVKNPPNPYDRFSSEYLGKPPPTKLEIFEEVATRSMISESWSNEFGNRKIVNCYRGCIHGCTYCFARRYHEFIGFGAGTDFETKLVAKINSPEVLRKQIMRSRKPIHKLEFSFATDPYLPIEANYELTRRCLEVCRDFRIPVRIMTKAPLVLRDLGLLKSMDAVVCFSIPFADRTKSKPFEPFTPTPEVRFRAMKQLNSAGIPTGVGIAPVIPGYNDEDIPIVLEKARKCGAIWAFMSMIHIDSQSIEDYFVSRLNENVPTRSKKILANIRREKGGSLQHRNFAERSSGKTARWKLTEDLFNLHFRRLGYRSFEKNDENIKNEPDSNQVVQGELFPADKTTT